MEQSHQSTLSLDDTQSLDQVTIRLNTSVSVQVTTPQHSLRHRSRLLHKTKLDSLSQLRKKEESVSTLVLTPTVTYSSVTRLSTQLQVRSLTKISLS